MSDDVKIKDTVSAILNPVREKNPLVDQEKVVWGEFSLKGNATDFSLKQEVLPEGSAIVEETITEVSVIDLKGKTFKFPGNFRMERVGDKVKFVADK